MTMTITPITIHLKGEQGGQNPHYTIMPLPAFVPDKVSDDFCIIIHEKFRILQ